MIILSQFMKYECSSSLSSPCFLGFFRPPTLRSDMYNTIGKQVVVCNAVEANHHHHKSKNWIIAAKKGIYVYLMIRAAEAELGEEESNRDFHDDKLCWLCWTQFPEWLGRNPWCCYLCRFYQFKWVCRPLFHLDDAWQCSTEIRMLYSSILYS